MSNIVTKIFEKFGLSGFYFFPHAILNYTTCVNICNERGTKLPNVNDFQIIREITANQSVFHQQANRTQSAESFLTYFIGADSYGNIKMRNP